MFAVIEGRVRAIIAKVLDTEPGFILLSTHLFEGVIGKRTIYRIARMIEGAYGIRFDTGEPELWSDVLDVVLATERAVATRESEAA